MVVEFMVCYNVEGIWKFCTQYFSRYGLLNSDEEDDVFEINCTKTSVPSKNSNTLSVIPGNGLTMYGHSPSTDHHVMEKTRPVIWIPY